MSVPTGQATLRTPDLAVVIRQAIQSKLFAVHTAIPAKVVAYYGEGNSAGRPVGSCDAQPLIMDRIVLDDGTVVAESVPVIPSVPVIQFGSQTSGFRIQFDLSPGDVVLLVFSERSLDSWLTAGGEVDPLTSHTHHMTDAIAIPGLCSFAPGTPWVPDMAGSSNVPSIGYQGGSPRVQFTKQNIVLGGNSDAVALASVVNTQLSNLASSINSFVGQYNKHTHPVSGVATLTPATTFLASTASTPSSVASSTVLAE